MLISRKKELFLYYFLQKVTGNIHIHLHLNCIVILECEISDSIMK